MNERNFDEIYCNMYTVKRMFTQQQQQQKYEIGTYFNMKITN